MIDNNLYLVEETTLEQIVIALKGILFSSNIEPYYDSFTKAFCSIFKDMNLFLDTIHKLDDDFDKIREELYLDLDYFIYKDPAAISKAYVVSTYNSYTAIIIYRFAHLLVGYGLFVQARLLSEYAHSKTGIDIHPGATIGVPFFIDHGTGIVIGETCEIKDHVSVYQGVTLGAKSIIDASSLVGVKRHPTIEENVIIYANATILGGSTVIGKGSIIGASAFILTSIPENSRISITKGIVQ